jgi:hypothetical protein
LKSIVKAIGWLPVGFQDFTAKKKGNCKQQPERQDHAHQERAQDYLENAKVPENVSVLAAQGGD